MDANITRLDRIRAEARQAAAKYSDINDACPYPWGSPAAIEFKREFAAAREALKDARYPGRNPLPTFDKPAAPPNPPPAPIHHHPV